LAPRRKPNGMMPDTRSPRHDFAARAALVRAAIRRPLKNPLN
jgi:hypothetical protein